MRIKDPLIELLAIKLYEHDQGEWPLRESSFTYPWMKLADERRQLYRDMASGGADIPENG
jgi:hypothetical protein